MVRIRVAGEALRGFGAAEPAASVRLLLPPAGHDDVVLPEWNGNEFLFADGSRPPLRTFTPLRIRREMGAMDLGVVLHDGGVASTWAASARVGDTLALSGPGRGYVVDPDARHYLLAGDETALPAITELIEVLPGAARVDVNVELADPRGRLALPEREGMEVHWHDLNAGARPGDALVAALSGLTFETGARIWAAGEAAAMQRIRRLLGDRGLARSQVVVRGYWKRGSAGDDDS